MKYFKRVIVIVCVLIFASLLFIKVFATTTIDASITTGAIVGTSISIVSDSNQIKLGASSDVGLSRSMAGVLKITNGSTEYGAIDTSQLKLNGTDILATANTFMADQTAPHHLNSKHYDPDDPRPAGWPSTVADANDNEFEGENLLAYSWHFAPLPTYQSHDSGTDVVTLTSSPGWSANQKVLYHTTGTTFGGLTNDTYYYVKAPSGTTFQLSTMVGGEAIDLTSAAGSGTHTFDFSPSTVSQTIYPGYLYMDNANIATVADFYTKPLAISSSQNFAIMAHLPIGIIGSTVFGICLLNDSGTGYAVQWSPTAMTNSNVKAFTGTVTAWVNGAALTPALNLAPHYLRIERTGGSRISLAVSNNGMQWYETGNYTDTAAYTRVGFATSIWGTATGSSVDSPVTLLVDYLRVNFP